MIRAYKTPFLLFMLAFFAFACSEDMVYVPKQMAYHRIELPEHAFQSLSNEYPYSFEYSKYGQIKDHVSFLTDSEYFWIDIQYPEFDATLFLAYKMINNNMQYEDFVTDAHKLAGKHLDRALDIDDYIMRTPKGLLSTVFELKGDVPTPFQFFVTDSVKHYFRGALYFNHSNKTDSLEPVAEYIKLDAVQMINTMYFKSEKEFDYNIGKWRKLKEERERSIKQAMEEQKRKKSDPTHFTPYAK